MIDVDDKVTLRRQYGGQTGFCVLYNGKQIGNITKLHIRPKFPIGAEPTDKWVINQVPASGFFHTANGAARHLVYEVLKLPK
jgi:hypothetical protein